MRNTAIAATILLGSSIVTVPGQAQTVKTWVDEQGVTHYSDQAPVGGEAEVEVIVVPAAAMTGYETEEANERIQKQLEQLEQDRRAREQAAEHRQKTRALEEAIAREPLVVEPKKKESKRRRNPGGPYPRPLRTYPLTRPGLPAQN